MYLHTYNITELVRNAFSEQVFNADNFLEDSFVMSTVTATTAAAAALQVNKQER